MFRNKKHIFFDLDHTLWDYETSSDETLRELWNQYELNNHGVPLNNFLNKFREVNGALWDRFHAGEIDKDVIRKDRFPTIFSELSANNFSSTADIQDDYIQVCPTKSYLIDGALELLESLTGRYELHIITNGFEEIQGTKLKSGRIGHFFDQIITSGMAGSQKPESEIFDYSLTKAKATKNESIMIGDNPISDIHGAYLAGIDQVFYNPDGLECPITPTLEITSMKDLIKYF
jgi:YjjG family noncanonical pyrimidine nucleotidase